MKRFVIALSVAAAIATAAQAQEYNLGVDTTFPQPDFGTMAPPVTVPLPPIVTMVQPTGPSVVAVPILDNNMSPVGVLGGGQIGNTQFMGAVVDTPAGPHVEGSVKYPVYPETTIRETQQ